MASGYSGSSHRHFPADFQKNSTSSIGYAACSDGIAATGLARWLVPEKTLAAGPQPDVHPHLVDDLRGRAETVGRLAREPWWRRREQRRGRQGRAWRSERHRRTASRSTICPSTRTRCRTSRATRATRRNVPRSRRSSRRCASAHRRRAAPRTDGAYRTAGPLELRGSHGLGVDENYGALPSPVGDFVASSFTQRNPTWLAALSGASLPRAPGT